MAAATVKHEDEEEDEVEQAIILPERIWTDDAVAYTERLLLLCSLIKPMEAETQPLITEVKDYLNSRGEEVLTTSVGHVHLRTTQSRRVQVCRSPVGD